MDPPSDDRSQPFQRITRWLIPNRSTALRQYRSRARIYDLELFLFEPVRQRSIELLRLKDGDRVLDVGCGTGLSFTALENLVGADGSIVGIEQSPEMIERARARADDNNWRNIEFVSASVEEAAIPYAADAALFHFTHDIMRTPKAVGNVVSHLKPGARVVAAGLKWAPVRTMPLNLFVWNAALRSTSTLEGLARPWSNLETILQELEVEQMLGGTVYVARGIVK
ncbi:MAG TPA: methyltransferase domain-containing protein [Candidatus Binatus sp.]|uniref:class I SAM-dependent methyltransferase n=1 Tax=Candidatus Binatus sp. TaxID=2811406 RepID=UPI002F42EBCD